MATHTIDVLPAKEGPSGVRERRARIDGYAFSLVLITLVAAGLRIHAIASKSFWLDEGISVEIARLPWQQFLFVLRHREANMALYYLLLRVWLAMGSSEGFI